MNRNTNTQPSNERCTVCGRKTVEAEFDYETRSWTHWSTCSRACGIVRSEQPYCHTPDCSQRVCGTRTHLTNGPATVDGTPAVYACERCGLSGTAEDFKRMYGRQSGYTDQSKAQAGINPWLVETRLRNLVDGTVWETAYRFGVAEATRAAADDLFDGHIDGGMYDGCVCRACAWGRALSGTPQLATD